MYLILYNNILLKKLTIKQDIILDKNFISLRKVEDSFVEIE